MRKTAMFVLLSWTAVSWAFSAGPTIRTVEDPGGLAPALAEIARKGDFLISDGTYTAVVAASARPAFSTINYGNTAGAGYLAAFIPPGASKRVAIQIGVPSVRIDGRTLPLGEASVRQDGTDIVVQVTAAGEAGIKLEIQTRYGFAYGSSRITIVSEIRNLGSSEVTGLSFSLGANARQNLAFGPSSPAAFPGRSFRVWQRPDHALGWFDPNPSGTRDNPLPGRLRPGQVYRLSYCVVAGVNPIEVLDKLYALAGTKKVLVPFKFPEYEGLTEIMINDPVTGAVFYRAFLDRSAPFAIPLPPGAYALRACFFPAIIESNFGVDGSPSPKPVAVAAPKFGRITVSVVDRSKRPVPGKVSFVGLAPSPSPYFRPDNPVETGRAWEGFKNSVYPFQGPAEVVLPAGTYLATSSRGPEYTRDERVVEVFEGENTPLEFCLERAVSTPGWVSVDPHMHTRNSDGNMGIADRLRSVVAEGLDVVVATDHNFVTDYGPDLERLGFGQDLAVIPGVEVTARTGSVHYNTYPVEVRPGEPKNGAISVEDETPEVLFGLSRSKDTAALIQVNHPRSRGLGYFLTYDLESDTAASAVSPFSLAFDLMEAMNGAKRYEANQLSTEDFFHLLNRGYHVRAVGVSDSHGIDGGEPGYARTYVLYDGPKGAALDRAAVIEAMKAGRSFLSNGPVVFVRANGRGLPGDLVRASKGRVELDVRVLGAPWLDVSEVRLVVNGERGEPLPMRGGDGRTIKFRDWVTLALERDGWIAVEVRGRVSLYPVIQQRSGDGAAESAAFPYALTNPIFFDVDGNGRSDPVWPEKVVIK
jgi:hypothetical protein